MMPDEGFLRRWSRLKSTGGAAGPAADMSPAPAPMPAPAAATPAPARARDEDNVDAAAPRARLPTLEDAARLTPDADFSAFVARGVDKSVQRLALKKLFADPHFNAIDGLDIYMSDYNKASPLSPGMLASLEHAPNILASLFGEREGAEAAAAAPAAGAPEHEAGPVHEQAEPTQPSTQEGKA